MLLLQPGIEQRLKRHDVTAHEVDRAVEHALIQLRRRQRLIQPTPAPVPRLQLGAAQLRLDFQYVSPEELESLLVFDPRALEVEPDLQATVACVMPGLVMELRAAEMQLHQAAAPSGAAERAQRSRQPRFHPLAQPSEEVHRREHRPSDQLAEYIS